jgi:UDP:flavonoid glycosyltransferase YjiC (YdhE family)
VLLVAGPDPGHALPVLGVARALRDRGHRTTFVSGDRWATLCDAEEHAFVRLPGLAATPDDDDLAHVLWTRAGGMARPLHALVAHDPPDLVVADVLTNVGGFVAGLFDVPWLQVVPHHLGDPDPLVPPVGLGRLPSRMPWRRLDDAHVRAAQARSVADGHRARAAARVLAGLPPRGGHPVARLLQSVPALEPRRSAWPGDAHPLGPLALDLPGSPLAPPPGDAPLVVVTDSTASSLPTPLGEAALRGLVGCGVRLVVTSGRDDLTAWPGAVVGRGPHGPLLADADLAVGPGGGGFTAKALAAGVPLVVVPLAGDQPETAARVVAAGVGLRLSPRRATPERLARTVRAALADPSLAVAARRAAWTCHGLGATRAAEIVERHLPGATARRPSHRGASPGVAGPGGTGTGDPAASGPVPPPI